VEPAMPADFNAAVAKLGWDVTPVSTPRTYWGSVNAVQFTPEGLTAVADQRRTSDAGGD
jgi:gamma-glutamyltranspeptidase